MGGKFRERGAAALGLAITPNLRDTAASLAIQTAPRSLRFRAYLAYKSAATTLNRYAGIYPDDLDDVAARLDAAAREAVGSSERYFVSLAHRPKPTSRRTGCQRTRGNPR